MNKSYKDRIFLKSVYQLVSLFGLTIMVLGFFGIMGVIGHSETEYVVSSVKIWTAWDYVFYVLLSLMVASAGYAFESFGRYGVYVQEKWLKRLEKR